MEYFIDPQKKYVIPDDLSIVRFENKLLVISPNTANWMVFPSELHIDILKAFQQEKSIEETLSHYIGDEDAVQEVVTQLEAKRFCTKHVISATEGIRTLHLYLTNKCNLTCPHCYMFAGKAMDNELSTQEIFKLIEDYASIGGNQITLSGGEPCMHKDINDIIKFAYDHNLKVRILSNGTLMTDKWIEDYSKYIDSIQISVDGFSEETNSEIRGRGNFEKSLHAIDQFVLHGVNTSVAVTPSFNLLKNNINQYANFAISLKSKYTGKTNFLVKFSEGLLEGRDVCPSKSLNDEYYNLMMLLNKKLHGDHYELLSFIRAYSNDVIMDNCMFGVFSVTSNGDVYFCARITGLQACGNIKTTPFDEIVQLSKEAEKATCIDNLKPCKECNLKYICGGGCRIDEWPSLVNRTSFADINYDTIEPRSCNQNYKNKFYKLMIDK